MVAAAVDMDQDQARHVASDRQTDPPDKARQFDAALRLAWFLARPFEFLSDEHCQLALVDGFQFRHLTQFHAFQGPLNRHLAALLGNEAETISQETICRAATSPELRLAIVFLTAPLDEARDVVLMLAAALLSRRVRNLMLKQERNAIQETLGLIGFSIAMQEAPLLYPLLSKLDTTPAEYPLFQPDIPLASRQALAVDLGFQIIGRFLDTVEPVFAEMFAKRLPGEAGYAERDRFVAPMDDTHCKQLLRLIRRRHETWSDIIG